MKITLKHAQFKLKGLIQLSRMPDNYDSCKLQAQPYLDVINEEAKKLAKKHGRRHKDFTFTYLAR